MDSWIMCAEKGINPRINIKLWMLCLDCLCQITHHSAFQTADVVCIGFDLGTYMTVDNDLNSLFL